MAALTTEIGVAGVSTLGGQILDDSLRELAGPEGRRILREMRDTDPTCGAIVTAIELAVRKIEWNVEPADESASAQEEAEFVEGVLKEDMSHSWQDGISDALTMLVFGWAYLELVWKRRVGPDQTDPAKKSKFTDGRIGLRKAVARDQQTLDKWLLDGSGGVQGFVQRVPDKGGTVTIPIERALLFRTSRERGSPEGRSTLRSAYKAWWCKRNVELIEAVGIERELAGLPVIRIPAKYLRADATADEIAIRRHYEKIARDLKFNEQGALVLPSDPFPDENGGPSSMRLVDIELLSASGSRAIDTGGVVNRYDIQMARAALADFLTLGANREGCFALSKSQTDLFLAGLESIADIIADTWNRHALDRLWQYNGIDPRLKPTLKHGQVAPTDLKELGEFLKALAATGIPIGGDPETENMLRRTSGLPEVDEEVFAERERVEQERTELELEAARAALEQPRTPPGG